MVALSFPPGIQFAHGNESGDHLQTMKIQVIALG
jgi:hypothetical protein